MSNEKKGLTYSDAGVDTERGQEEVRLISEMCKKTYDKNVLAGVGGFGAMYELDLSKYKNPVLVSGTDGVGTKLMIAQNMDIHNTLGFDLVAMCVNDIICQGAEPLFFLDYIGTGHLEPNKMANIVKGIAEACEVSGASLIGGETAEMPDMYSEEEYDLAGFVVGVVEKDKLIDGSNAKPGDVILSLPSSGIHSNGLSLARKIVTDVQKMDYSDHVEELGKSIGEELLTPTKIYVKEVLGLLEKVEVKAIAHNTGGGLYENIPRSLPEGLGAEVNLSEIEVPKVFNLLQKWGHVETEEMYKTFNMGVGMFLIVDPSDVDECVEHFTDYEVKILGKVNDSGELTVEY